MRQSDGSEIFGPNDPRNIVIGIIHVTPNDDRQSVLTAITTQEKLGRDQIILDLPAQNKAFKAALDFEGLRQMSGEIEAGLVLLVPPKSKIAALAGRQGFTLYHSLDELAAAEFPEEEGEEEAQIPPPPPPAPVVEVDEDDHTQTFPTVLPPSATTPTANLPGISQPVSDSQEEPPTLPQIVEMPAPSAAFFPVEIPSVSVSPETGYSEDETPTDPALAVPGSAGAEQVVNPPPVAVPDQQQINYLPVPVSGGALVPSNALPPVFYDPMNVPRHRSWRGLIIICVVLVILILVGVFFNRPILDLFFPPTATVTITPASEHVQHTYQFTAVLGIPDPTNDQVDARALYATSQMESQTVKATGLGHTAGQQAQGMLTFYNSSATPQTVEAGTVIFDANGLAVVNNDTITLPGLDPAEGIAGTTDNAHTINVGSKQNIPANDFHTTLCCGGAIYVTNDNPFTGGQDAQPFTYVQQGDIDGVTQSLEATLAPQATAILQSQVRSTEKQAGSPRCAPLVDSNHQAGDRATTVTVRVTTTCMSEVYDLQAVQVLAARKLTQDASKNPGAAYVPVGQILANVAQAVPDSHGNILLQVNAVGVWAYQFTPAQIRQLASMIAGKSGQDARTILFKQPGVERNGVTITLTGVGATAIPDDTDHITIDISAVDGLH